MHMIFLLLLIFIKVFFGNFVIYGRLKATDPWTTLYTGANTTNLEATIIFINYGRSFINIIKFLW